MIDHRPPAAAANTNPHIPPPPPPQGQQRKLCQRNKSPQQSLPNPDEHHCWTTTFSFHIQPLTPSQIPAWPIALPCLACPMEFLALAFRTLSFLDLTYRNAHLPTVEHREYFLVVALHFFYFANLGKKKTARCI